MKKIVIITTQSKFSDIIQNEFVVVPKRIDLKEYSYIQFKFKDLNNMESSVFKIIVVTQKENSQHIHFDIMNKFFNIKGE